MAIEHINRKGQKYYLHQKPTKKGKLKYFFSMKCDGSLVDEVPEGYEIYENPNAQVFLRIARPRLITDIEMEIVKQGMKEYSHVSDYRLDVKKNIITVFTPDQDPEKMPSELGGRFGFAIQDISVFTRNIHYTPVMRFILLDESERIFVAKRYCFRGSIDDWISVGVPGSLYELAGAYLKHLGKESFYELI